MNLAQTNELAPILGDMTDLPLTAQWAAASLLAHELLLWSSTDRRCFFYCFNTGSAGMLAMRAGGLAALQQRRRRRSVGTRIKVRWHYTRAIHTNLAH